MKKKEITGEEVDKMLEACRYSLPKFTQPSNPKTPCTKTA